MSRAGTDALIVASLAAGGSYPTAASRAGVSERTVRRRLAEPEFASRVDGERSAFVERTAAQLLGGTDEAVAALRDLVRTGPPAVRVRAALGLLSAAASWRETSDVEARLGALESAATDAIAAREGWCPVTARGRGGKSRPATTPPLCESCRQIRDVAQRFHANNQRRLAERTPGELRAEAAELLHRADGLGAGTIPKDTMPRDPAE